MCFSDISTSVNSFINMYLKESKALYLERIMTIYTLLEMTCQVKAGCCSITEKKKSMCTTVSYYYAHRIPQVSMMSQTRLAAGPTMIKEHFFSPFSIQLVRLHLSLFHLN